MARHETDYIIVGAGSAGCVLANRLSEYHRVTLIEAGPADHAWDYRIHMPAALSQVLASRRYNWGYYSEPEPGLGHRRLFCPRGRALGGSSSINGMIFVRGNPGDFDAWATQPGLADWSFQQCLPYFRRLETCLYGDDAWRGREGPLHVTRSNGTNPLFHAWLDAGVNLGHPRSNDFNGKDQEGVGWFDRTIYQGRRNSTARAYLTPIRHRSNLAVIKTALVTRVILEGGRATGVEFMRRGAPTQCYADAEVILAAGAINSPQLLQLSGIGDADHLRSLDIPVNAQLPGVGRNLQDHLEVYVQFSCRKPVSLYPALKWYRMPFIGMEWYLRQTGPGSTNHFDAGAFLRSDAAARYPDLQFHFLPIAMDYDGKSIVDGHGFQFHVGPMKPTSRGRVTLNSSDPTDSPRIAFNYNMTEADRRTMRRGIEIGRQIVADNAFDPYRGAEVRPGVEDIDAFIARRAESAYHPCGTCRMGQDELAVVDGEARVHGMENLRVIDASIFPDITNGNLNAPVIMAAEKIAARILGTFNGNAGSL